MADAKKARSRKKKGPPERNRQNRNRVFVHPQGSVLQCEQGVFAPGQEVPVDDLNERMVADWYHEGLLIEEAMYRLYHGGDWNARHKTDRVKPGQGGVDIHDDPPPTGDEITDPKGDASIIGGVPGG